MYHDLTSASLVFSLYLYVSVTYTWYHLFIYKILQVWHSMTWPDPIHQVVLAWPSLQLSKALLRDLQQFDEGIEGEFSVTWVQILLSPQMQVHRLSCGWLQKSSCVIHCNQPVAFHILSRLCQAVPTFHFGEDLIHQTGLQSNMTQTQTLRVLHSCGLRSVVIRFFRVQALSWSMESKTPCTASPCKTCERLSCTEKGVGKRMNKNEKSRFLIYIFLSFLIFFKFFASSFASCPVTA